MENKNKSKILSYLIGTLIAIVLTVSLAIGFGAFSAPNVSLMFAYLSNATFITAVFYCGVGVLAWISTTGFFDIFSFGFKSLKYLFTPAKRDRSEGGYYEYAMEKREKNRTKMSTGFILVIGIVFLVISIVFLVLWNSTGAADIPIV